MVKPSRRPGRKRHLNVVRRNDGKAVSPQPTPAGEIKRLVEASLAGMRQPEWGTVYGQLLLGRKITPEQFNAAKRWDQAAVAYQAAIAAPGRMKALSLERGINAHAPDPDTTEGELAAARDRRVVGQYLKAQSALSAAGKMAELAVRSVVQDREYPAGFEVLCALVAGLDALSAHYRLTNQQNRNWD